VFVGARLFEVFEAHTGCKLRWRRPRRRTTAPATASPGVSAQPVCHVPRARLTGAAVRPFPSWRFVLVTLVPIPCSGGSPRPSRRRTLVAALAAVVAVCAVASVVLVAVAVRDGRAPGRTALWGWTKDSMESGDGKISAEEVEQLNSILEAQDNLKKNLQRMAEKLDKGRGTEIAVEQGNNSPPGPDGPRGPDGPKGPPGPAGVVGPQGKLGAEGDAGVKGKEGAQGPPGRRGPDGEQGEIGPAGREGVKGDMGSVGYPGPPGPNGPQGPPGPEQPNMLGPVGPSGGVGPAGPDGPPGEVGPRGSPGQEVGPPPPPIIVMPPPVWPPHVAYASAL